MIYSKIEMDLGNYAHRLNSSVITSGDTWDTPLARIIDGTKTHFFGEGSFAKRTTPTHFIITFPAAKTISRFSIFTYPAISRIQTVAGLTNSGLKSFKVTYYNSGGVETELTGLTDKNSEYGQSAVASITSNVVTNLIDTNINVLSFTEVSALGIKVYIYDVWDTDNKARICECEVTRTIDLSDYVFSADINARKDVEFRRFIGSELVFTLNNADRRFSPNLAAASWGSGWYNSELRPGLEIRTYIGTSSYLIRGHFWVSQWQVDSKQKIVTVTAYDISKQLQSYSPKENEILGNTFANQLVLDEEVEYCLEYLLIIANIPTGYMYFYNSNVNIPVFYPFSNLNNYNFVYVWAMIKDLVESVVDSDLYVNEQGQIVFKYYADSLPHEWKKNSVNDFKQSGYSAYNTSIEDSSIKIPPPYVINTAVQFNSGTVEAGTRVIHENNPSAGLDMIAMPRMIGYRTAGTPAGPPLTTTEYAQVISNPYYGSLKKIRVYLHGDVDDVVSIGLWTPPPAGAYTGGQIWYQTVAITTGDAYWQDVDCTVGLPAGTYWLRVTIYKPPSGPTTTQLFYNSGYPESAYRWDGLLWEWVAGSSFKFQLWIDTPAGFNPAINPVYQWKSDAYSLGGIDLHYKEFYTDSHIPAGDTIEYVLDDGNGTPRNVYNGVIPTGTPGTDISYIQLLMTHNMADVEVGEAPYINKIKVQYELTATWNSEAKDLGQLEFSYGPLDFTTNDLPAGASITLYTSVSDDNITWDSGVAVVNKQIQSAVKRYIKIRAEFVIDTQAHAEIGVPTIYEILLIWNTGGIGAIRFNGAVIDLLPEDLQQTITDDFAGENNIYNKIMIQYYKVNYESTPQDIYVSGDQTPILISAGESKTISCYVTTGDLYAIPDADMTFYVKDVLWGTAHMFTNGETFDGLTVSFIKNPTCPQVTLTTVQPRKLDELIVKSKYYNVAIDSTVSVSDELSTSKYGIRSYYYQNKYITAKSMAQEIAVKLLTLFAEPMTYIANPQKITYSDGIYIGGLVKINNEYESGINELFEIIGYNHNIDTFNDKVLPDTFLQLKAINMDSFIAPLYWGRGYWGSRNGIPQYWGGNGLFGVANEPGCWGNHKWWGQGKYWGGKFNG